MVGELKVEGGKAKATKKKPRRQGICQGWMSRDLAWKCFFGFCSVKRPMRRFRDAYRTWRAGPQIRRAIFDAKPQEWLPSLKGRFGH